MAGGAKSLSEQSEENESLSRIQCDRQYDPWLPTP